MADRTSLEDNSQCAATIELLGLNYGSKIAMAQGKEMDYIKDELQHQVSDDKATKVTPGHPDKIEAGSKDMFQHVLGGEMPMHESKIHHKPPEDTLEEATKGVAPPNPSRYSQDHHETSDTRRSDPTPTIECRGIFVRQPCPTDADLTAWYALGLCMVFCIWGGLIYLRQ